MSEHSINKSYFHTVKKKRHGAFTDEFKKSW